MIVNEFKDKADVINALIASQYIPGWTDGLHPVFTWRGRPCVDGGLLNNIPIPDDLVDCTSSLC